MKSEFYPRHNLKKSGKGPGGQFNGPSIKHILREENLVDLETILPSFELTTHFTDYLRSIRELHKMCIAPVLEDYNAVVDNFQKKISFVSRVWIEHDFRNSCNLRSL